MFWTVVEPVFRGLQSLMLLLVDPFVGPFVDPLVRLIMSPFAVELLVDPYLEIFVDPLVGLLVDPLIEPLVDLHVEPFDSALLVGVVSLVNAIGLVITIMSLSVKNGELVSVSARISLVVIWPE